MADLTLLCVRAAACSGMKSEKRETVTLRQRSTTPQAQAQAHTRTHPFAFVHPIIWIMFISLTLLAPVQFVVVFFL